jgi:type IV secretion system protein TrbI
MTVEQADPGGLAVRAAKPAVIRLRRGATLAVVLGASSLLVAAFCWSFVLAPRLKSAASPAAAEAPPTLSAGKSRPTELISAQPATYDRLELTDLPRPRTLGHAGDEDVKPAARRPQKTDAVASKAREDEARTSHLFFQGPTAELSEPLGKAAAAASPPPSADHILTAGTVLPAVLLTAIDTSRPGPVIGVVSASVFDSSSGEHIVVPQGSRLVGRHEGGSRHGERRVIISWRSLTLPGGASVTLADEPGVDATGAVGVAGRVERRLGQLSLATLFAGAITTLGQFARDRSDDNSSLLGNAGDAAAIEASRVGGRLIDRELDVTPSIRLTAGTQVNVLLTRDLIIGPRL